MTSRAGVLDAARIRLAEIAADLNAMEPMFDRSFALLDRLAPDFRDSVDDPDLRRQQGPHSCECGGRNFKSRGPSHLRVLDRTLHRFLDRQIVGLQLAVLLLQVIDQCSKVIFGAHRLLRSSASSEGTGPRAAGGETA